MGHLEVAVGGVVVANEGEAVRPDGHCAVLADTAYAVRGREIGGGASHVEAMRHLEVAVGGVVVADEGQTIGPDGHCGELTDIALALKGCAGGGGTDRIGRVETVGHLEVAVGGIVVADEGYAVSPDGHCAVLADIACAVRGVRDGRLGTGQVRAEGQLENLVSAVIVADETVTGGNGH